MEALNVVGRLVKARLMLEHDRKRVPTTLQLAILRRKIRGHTDLAVARALGVGERTVRRHLDDLVGALQVSGRDELFVEIGRRGWLDGELDLEMGV